MMYSQSSCLLDGLVALSLVREREHITFNILSKRNSIKGHAFPREKHLTSVANYKKRRKKFTHGMSVQGKGCVQG